MKFKTVAEAFNYYNTKTLEEIETRAQEVKGLIETDPDVDIKSLNIELTGLSEAKESVTEKEAGEPTQRSAKFNVITGADFRGASDSLVTGDVYESREYRSAFFKSLMGKELTSIEKSALNKALEIEKRSDAYATSATIPVVIPTQTLNEVIKKARKANGLFNAVRHFNLSANVAIPVSTPAGNAIWNTEGAPVDSEAVTLANVTFGAYELIKVFSISYKVRQMSIDAFEAYITDELSQCIINTIDYSIVNGDGTGEGTGLETITWTDNTNQITTTAELTWNDITSAMALLKHGYGANAKFAMNSATLYNSVYGLKDGNERPVFIQNAQDDSVGKILSKEVIVDDNIADGDIYYGDFNYYGVNMANGIAIEASTQSSFKSGRIDFRGMALADCKPIIEEAFVKIVITGAGE